MKKSLPWLLLLAIVLACLWNGNRISRCTARWQGQLAGLEDLLEREDWPAIETLLRESCADWSAHRLYLHIVTEHDAVDDAEAMYRRCLAFAAAREPKELRAEAADLRDQLRLLAETERFSLGNIL